jgi:hypothetical protein
VLDGLNEVTLADHDPDEFGHYDKETGKIEVYVRDIVGWQP